MSQKNVDTTVTGFELTLSDAMLAIHDAQVCNSRESASRALLTARHAVSFALKNLDAVEKALKDKFNE